MEEAYEEGSIKNLGKILKAAAPFDKALQALRKAGVDHPITARDLAYARIQACKEKSLSSLYEEGSYVREGKIYTPYREVLFISDSPILESAEEATDCFRAEKDFYLDPEKYFNLAEVDRKKTPEERRVLLVDKRENYFIPTKRFADEEITLWAFKDQAMEYGQFLLGERMITKMYVAILDAGYVNKQNHSFARQIWLDKAMTSYDGHGSNFGGGEGLELTNVVRGVLKC